MSEFDDNNSHEFTDDDILPEDRFALSPEVSNIPASVYMEGHDYTFEDAIVLATSKYAEMMKKLRDRKVAYVSTIKELAFKYYYHPDESIRREIARLEARSSEIDALIEELVLDNPEEWLKELMKSDGKNVETLREVINNRGSNIRTVNAEKMHGIDRHYGDNPYALPITDTTNQ